MIRRPEVLAITKMSSNALDAAIADSRFPAPVKIGPRSIAFFVDEVAEWQKAAAAEREAKRQRAERQRAEQEARRAAERERAIQRQR